MVLPVSVWFSDVRPFSGRHARASSVAILGAVLFGWALAADCGLSASDIVSAKTSWDEVQKLVARGDKEAAIASLRVLRQLDPWHAEAPGLAAQLKADLAVKWLREARQLLAAKSPRKAGPVSYTHLTLPTTPYV